jgi:hypothetical protein
MARARRVRTEESVLFSLHGRSAERFRNLVAFECEANPAVALHSNRSFRTFGAD